MTRHSVTGLSPVDFFTQGYRISGHINTRAKTVGDTLNDRLSSYVELQDVYIARVNKPGEIVVSYSYAQLLKDNLLFAIVSSEESFSKAGRSVSYFGRQRTKAWLALFAFEIQGFFMMTGRSADFEAYLAKGVDVFIPIQDGVAQLSEHPDISFSGEAFLVNRLRIDLFCLNPAM